MEASGLNEDGKGRKIIVTGCLAQRYGGQLAEDMPEAGQCRLPAPAALWSQGGTMRRRPPRPSVRAAAVAASAWVM
jgi:hypothetical protein